MKKPFNQTEFAKMLLTNSINIPQLPEALGNKVNEPYVSMQGADGQGNKVYFLTFQTDDALRYVVTVPEIKFISDAYFDLLPAVDLYNVKLIGG